MKTIASVVTAFFVVGGVLLLMGAAPRPISEGTLLNKINGETSRWRMTDGGASGMFGSGIQCMPIPATVSVIKAIPSAAVHLCFPPDAGWDGGCNSTVTDINFGDPLLANTPVEIVLQQTTAQICMVPATGSANVPVFEKK